MPEPQPIEAVAAQLQDGDVLVVRSPHTFSDAARVRLQQQMGEFWARQGCHVPVLILEDGLTLETIPRERMRQLGWVSVDAADGYR